MERRTFLKAVGATGLCTLIEIIWFHRPTYATGAGCEAAGLRGPFDLALDASGRLLVTDPPSYCVLSLDEAYKPDFGFGGPGAAAGKMNFPKGIAVDGNGLVYVADCNNCRVQIFSPTGEFLRVIGSIGSIGGTFANPQGVHADAEGRLLVADTRNHRIQIFRGSDLVAVIGDLGDGEDQFRLPTACVTGPEGDIFVLDSKHCLVKVFGKDLKFRRCFGGVGSAPGLLNLPQGMTLDDRGHLWIADTNNHRLQEFTLEGTLVSVLGRHGRGPGEFDGPTGVACRGAIVCVADNGNGRVQVLSRTQGEKLHAHLGNEAH